MAKWHTSAEASEYLKDTHGVEITPRKLRDKRTQGGGPRYTRFGNSPRYSKADLNDWAENLATFESTAEEPTRNGENARGAA